MSGEVYRFQLPESEDPTQAPEITPEPADNLYVLPPPDRPVTLFDQAQMLSRKSNVVVEVDDKRNRRRIKVAGSIGAVAGAATLALGLYVVKKKRRR